MSVKTSLPYRLVLIAAAVLCATAAALLLKYRADAKRLAAELENATAALEASVSENLALSSASGEAASETEVLRAELEQQAVQNEALRTELEAANAAIAAYEDQILTERERELIRQNHTMTVGYAETSKIQKFGYWLYKPNLTEENLGLPLVVYLHGTHGVGTDPNRVIRDTSLSQALAEDRLYPNALILIPQCSKQDWTDILDDTMELIEQIAEEYEVDRSRISLTGASLGGIGCWSMLLEYGDYFSAAVPVGSQVVSPGQLGRISKTLPIWAFQGTNDEVVGSLQSVARILEAQGCNFRLTELQGYNHSVQFVYTDPDYDILGWMISQRKPK